MTNLKKLIGLWLAIVTVAAVTLIFQNCAERINMAEYDASSSSATSPPQIIFRTENQTVTEGQPLNLTITAAGKNPKYSWYKNSDALSAQITNSLSIPSTTMNDAGVYRIQVSNAGGMDTVDINVTVVAAQAPSINCTTAELAAVFALNGTRTLVNGQYQGCVPSQCIDTHIKSGSTCYQRVVNCAPSELAEANATSGTKAFSGSGYGACSPSACVSTVTATPVGRKGQYDQIASVNLATFRLNNSKCEQLVSKLYSIRSNTSFTIPNAVRVQSYSNTDGRSCGKGDYNVIQPNGLMVAGGCSGATWNVTYYMYQ